MYNRQQVQPSTENFEITELEDDSDQDQFADLDTFMTHHTLIMQANEYDRNILPL